ncbi:MAG: VWA domain-containing protein [Solirubrobacterales bacterium]|nr:VWA domain-containing protein [Solirubrobacterales bacterium]
MSEAFTRQVVAFGRVLREAGLEVGPGRIADALRGIESIDLTRQEDVYWALQSTLVSRREEVEPFNRAFDAWFLRRAVRPPDRAREDPRQARKGAQRLRRDAQPAHAEQASAGDPESIGHSAHEVLREKDFAAMSPEEFAAARSLITALAADRPLRRSRRSRPSRRGSALDMRSLARASIATGGEPIERRFRRRSQKPRKLVILCDVSGSMEAYTRALLLYLHASVRSGDGVEVFAFGTRLTRLTSELTSRDPEAALARAAQRVVDWASGTRIGASLKTYNDVWGRWALTRGAVVVIFSDGWERGDHAQVGEQMARLHRAAFAVVWVNPLLGSSDYQPLGGGMRAALPFVDRFVSGHNLASLQALSGLLAGIAHRHLV